MRHARSMAGGMAALDAGKAAFCGKAVALGRGNGMRTSALFKSFTARGRRLSHVYEAAHLLQRPAPKLGALQQTV